MVNPLISNALQNCARKALSEYESSPSDLFRKGFTHALRYTHRLEVHHIHEPIKGIMSRKESLEEAIFAPISSVINTIIKVTFCTIHLFQALGYGFLSLFGHKKSQKAFIYHFAYVIGSVFGIGVEPLRAIYLLFKHGLGSIFPAVANAHEPEALRVPLSLPKATPIEPETFEALELPSEIPQFTPHKTTKEDLQEFFPPPLSKNNIDPSPAGDPIAMVHQVLKDDEEAITYWSQGLFFPALSRLVDPHHCITDATSMATLRALKESCLGSSFLYTENFLKEQKVDLRNAIPTPEEGVTKHIALPLVLKNRLGEDHNVLFFIDVEKKTITYFNPKGTPLERDLSRNTVIEGKKLQDIFQVVREKFPDYAFGSERAGPQKDHHNCGVYCLMYIVNETGSLGLPLDYPPIEARIGLGNILLASAGFHDKVSNVPETQGPY